jgi:hypothetical protein
MPDPADRAFQRFLASREPAALAEVFDRTAPELLLIAAHFDYARAQAEDLL